MTTVIGGSTDSPPDSPPDSASGSPSRSPTASPIPPSRAYGGGWLVVPVRPGDPADGTALAVAPATLAALFAACSPETVRLRFFGRLKAFPREYADAVLAGRPDVHDAVVAYGPGRTGPAGLASLAAGPAPRTAELGLLVADAWQRRGAGAAMLGLLLARARARGVEQVAATVLPGRSGLLAALERRPELEAADLSRTGDGMTGVYKLSRLSTLSHELS